MKNITRKQFLQVTAAAGVMATFAACSKEAPPPATGEETSSAVTSDSTGEEPQELMPEEGAELTFWTNKVAFGTEIAAAFEAEFGVKVNVEEVGFDSISKLMLEGPAGNAADVVWGTHSNVLDVYNSGVALEVDPTIVATMQEELQTAAIDAMTIDGQMYGYPLGIETTVLAYNKDVVETPATTYEEIFEVAAEFNNADENKFYYLNVMGMYTFYPLFSAAGAYLFGADGMDNENPGFNTPEFIQGLEYIAQIGAVTDIAASDLLMNAGPFLDQNFIDGNTAYYQVGPWSLATFADAGVNYGLIPHPTLGGNPAKPWAAISANYVNYYTDYPIAAQMFAHYMTSVEAGVTLYTTDKNITARKDYLEIDGLKDDADMLIFAEGFANAVPQPSASNMNFIWTPTEAGISAVWDGTMTPEDAAAKIQADFDGLLASQ